MVEPFAYHRQRKRSVFIALGIIWVAAIITSSSPGNVLLAIYKHEGVFTLDTKHCEAGSLHESYRRLDRLLKIETFLTLSMTSVA